MLAEESDSKKGAALLAISAGEISGDRHAARVVEALKDIGPFKHFKGMGGSALRAAGVEIVVDCEKGGSVMGFLSVAKSLPKVFDSFTEMKRFLENDRPAALLLIDYPDFNFRLARHAQSFGIPVYWYIPPKVWVWRKGRIKKIKRFIEGVAAIFPFEEAFFQQNGYGKVTYVGHPTVDAIERVSVIPTDLIREKIGLKKGERSVLILAGSRKSEVDKILAPALKAFHAVSKKISDLRGIIVLPPNISQTLIKEAIEQEFAGPTDKIIVSTGDAIEAMRVTDVGILKSGTCNIEAACAGLPFTCVYSGSYLAKFIVSTLVSLNEYSPVNILLPGTVREIIQTKLNSQELEKELEKLLTNKTYQEKIKAGLRRVSEKLKVKDKEGTVAERCARWMAENFKSSNSKVE